MDVSDQPVYALSKEMQFRYPDIFGDYVPLMGALHIEQSLLVIHGQLISGYCLIKILSLHKFTTIRLSTGVDVNNIKRARYCVQITLCTEFIIRKSSY